jgi:hypothetical protein
MKIIRASEIGTFQFCQRSWWYQQQGFELGNKADLDEGTELHSRHGSMIMASSCLQMIAYISLLLAILSATIWVIQSIL